MKYYEKRRAAIFRIERRLDDVENLIRSIENKEETIMTTLADIRDRVAAEHTVGQSAIALLQQIAQMLRDALASQDPAAFQEIADMLDSDTQALSDAVVENTPAA